MYPAHELEARAPPPERQPRPKAAPWEATTAYQVLPSNGMPLAISPADYQSPQAVPWEATRTNQVFPHLHLAQHASVVRGYQSASGQLPGASGIPCSSARTCMGDTDLGMPAFAVGGCWAACIP